MSKVYQECKALTRPQAWTLYGKSNFRWVFNKMEIALRQGFRAGPTGTLPDKSGSYIVRPIYNIYGAGAGARKIQYDATNDKEQFLLEGAKTPGYFWSEWLPGAHLSVDYRRSIEEGNSWKASSVLQGFHKTEEDLTRFAFWKKLDTSEAPEVDSFTLNLEFLKETSFTGFNVEFRGGSIISVRPSVENSNFDHLEVGSKIVPIYQGDQEVEGEWLDASESLGGADLLGYRIKK